MDRIAQLLSANAEYIDVHERVKSRYPSRHLAIVTCMDARIDTFAALGLHLGEALVIRNAGGRVTPDVLRSLALAVHVLGVDSVAVMQHTECGLAGVTDEELRSITGADVHFLPIGDHAAALAEDVDVLASTSYLKPLKLVAGFVHNVETGAIEDLIRWSRPT